MFLNLFKTRKEEAKDYFSTVSAALCFLVGEEKLRNLIFFSLLLSQVLESYRKREKEKQWQISILSILRISEEA